jgi:uncharacterized protein (DUF1499 family)
LAEDGAHRVAPLTYSGDADQVGASLLDIIDRMPGTKLVSQDSGYLHFTFHSRIFRFVDDVELLFDIERKLIHIRSASRVGRWDLGVNRRRVEQLRYKLQAAENES